MAEVWAPRPDPDDALDAILDAAGRCFAAHGIRATSLSDVAREAGCSRPTVYRYVESRDALRVAYIRREAQRLGARIQAQLAGDGGARRSRARTGPADRWVADAVLAALHGVRSDPTLAAWFTPDDVGATLALALSPDLVADLAAAVVGPIDPTASGPSSTVASDEGAWTVRIVLSLLANPAADEATERRLIERFLVPVLTSARS